MKIDGFNIQLIIEGCRNNNPRSQRKLYEYFYPYGISIALRYAKNLTEAEEIFNDAFLRVFNNMDKYDSAYSFKTWLSKIIVNSSINYFRKFHKFRQTYSTDLIPEQAVSEDATYEVSLSENVLYQIQQLSPAYRVVFNLYVMEEYKHHEIAEMLGISVGASKSNLSRAKEKLRKVLVNKKEFRQKS